jgi:hypothetical protein
VAVLQVGLAREKITPTIIDGWIDKNGDGKYEPSKGDRFEDRNGNGKFDATWIAGYGNKRSAQGVHDDLWARAIVWDDGRSRVALVVLDAIGLFHDDVITIREMAARQCPGVDHVIVACTHCHEAPDLMGLWGENEFTSGVDEHYLEWVREQAVKAVCEAFKVRKAATVKIAQTQPVEMDLVEDSRPPVVLDNCIRMMKFEDAATGQFMGILMNFGNHPESLGGDNLQITADFPHYWIDGIERGIYYGDEKKRDGAGGIAVFANGAIGGLMTSLHSPTRDPWLNKTFGTNETTFERARAQGYRLSTKVLDHLQSGSWETLDQPALTLRARTFPFQVDNKLFRLGGALGVINRGFENFKYTRSEVDLLKVGPAWILTVPGEVYPEIIDGGIEALEGRDFPIQPVEVPPLRHLMRGRVNFVIGLGNDEIGYVLPKTEWDEKPPYIYKNKKYGEINSLGPETGPILYKMAEMLLKE